jgi:hypothetical protein
MVQPLHDYFDTFNKGQIDKITPNKDKAGKLTPSHVRGICHKIATSAGFRTGIPVCRCLPLESWDTMMTELYDKFTKTSLRPPKKKAKINPQDKLAACIASFEEMYQLQLETFGEDESNHPKELWENELSVVVRVLAETLVVNGAVSFREAAASVTHKAQHIKMESMRLAGRLKKEGWQPDVSTAVTAASYTDVQNTQIRINHLRDRVTDIARTIRQIKVASQQELICRQMLTLPSAYMRYAGSGGEPSQDCTPTLEALKKACDDKTGLKNPVMQGIMGQRSQGLWVGILTLVIASHADGRNCDGIRGEKNKVGAGNKLSPYDAEKHIGTVTHACIQGGNIQQNDTFSCRVEAVLKFADKKIKAAWKRVKNELFSYVEKNFPTNHDEIGEALRDMHLRVGMNDKISSLVDDKKQKLYLGHLKWIFILYCENLPANEEPTTNNFITTMLTDTGVSYVHAYLAWVSTALYSLKARAHENNTAKPLPAHIKLQNITSTAKTVKNSVFGTVANDLFDVSGFFFLVVWISFSLTVCFLHFIGIGSVG